MLRNVLTVHEDTGGWMMDLLAAQPQSERTPTLSTVPRSSGATHVLANLISLHLPSHTKAVEAANLFECLMLSGQCQGLRRTRRLTGLTKFAAETIIQVFNLSHPWAIVYYLYLPRLCDIYPVASNISSTLFAESFMNALELIQEPRNS